MQRSSISTGPSTNTSALSIMYHSMNSANFATSRLVISKDTVLAKVVPPPRRNQSRGMLLTQHGGNLTHAASGMRGNVTIWHPLANFGTFASAVADHIVKGIVFWRRMSTLEWRHMAHCASEWSRYPGISAVCQMAINFKPPRFLLGAVKK